MVRNKRAELISGWRNEKYGVYASPQSSFFASNKGSRDEGKPFSNMVFALERAACPIFGVAMFGVHMTG